MQDTGLQGFSLLRGTLEYQLDLMESLDSNSILEAALKDFQIGIDQSEHLLAKSHPERLMISLKSYLFVKFDT